MITALAGGVGAARLLRGLVRVVPPASVTAIVNTGDDMVFCGLHISPDLDTITRTLAGTFNEERGFGVAGETWTVLDELATLGGETWFALGDRDLATHLYRTRRLEQGATLDEVTAELTRAAGLVLSLVPATNDPLRTRLQLVEGEEVSFQEYFAKLHHEPAVAEIRFAGASSAVPAPGVLDAVALAERIVVCPSNPLLSIDPILAVPGLRSALEGRREDVVAVSPIIAGKALKGPADHLMAELGLEPSVVGVARYYAPWVGTLYVDEADRDQAGEVEAVGVRCAVSPTVLASAEAAAALCTRLLAD